MCNKHYLLLNLCLAKTSFSVALSVFDIVVFDLLNNIVTIIFNTN